MISRSRMSPRRMRALTVPSGWRSAAEISAWVSPSKKASSSARRCSGGSDFTAARTAPACSLAARAPAESGPAGAGWVPASSAVVSLRSSVRRFRWRTRSMARLRVRVTAHAKAEPRESSKAPGQRGFGIAVHGPVFGNALAHVKCSHAINQQPRRKNKRKPQIKPSFVSFIQGHQRPPAAKDCP